MTVDIIVCLFILLFILVICVTQYHQFSEAERLEAQLDERTHRR